MTKLIMHDGSERSISFDQALSIHAVLTGAAEPDNERQADFIAGVKDVEFDAPVQRVQPKDQDATVNDPVLAAILADETLRPAERARAVGKRLRERSLVRKGKRI